MRTQFLAFVLLVILLVACAPAPTQQTSEVYETSEVSPATATPAPSATPEPRQPTETVAPESPTPILAELDYDASDHAMFAPENYRLETRQWQGQEVQMLVHTDPTSKEERIDGMEVTINGEKQWVRGIWYETTEFPGTGGIILDIMVHPLQNERVYFANENGANAMYREYMKAIAYQLGISSEQMPKYLAEHDNKVWIRLSEAKVPGSKASPSLLKASELVEVDLSKPLVYAARSEPYLSQDLEDGAQVPEEAKLIFSDSRGRTSMFVSNGQLLLVSEWNGTVATRSAGTESAILFRVLELIARMSGGITEDESLIKMVIAMSGTDYTLPGETIISRDVFWTANESNTNYGYTLLELH